MPRLWVSSSQGIVQDPSCSSRSSVLTLVLCDLCSNGLIPLVLDSRAKGASSAFILQDYLIPCFGCTASVCVSPSAPKLLKPLEESLPSLLVLGWDSGCLWKIWDSAAKPGQADPKSRHRRSAFPLGSHIPGKGRTNQASWIWHILFSRSFLLPWASWMFSIVKRAHPQC